MRRLSWIFAAALGMALTAAAAHAQDKFPSKPIRVLVPYAAGGATDVVARVIAEQLRHSLGQSVVIDNKPGASGILAIEEMARAKPDGYTLMIGNISTNAMTPLLLAPKMSINYEKDVRIVSRIATIPSFLLITMADFPPKSVDELVAYAKAHPDKVRYGSAGMGAYQHLGMEMFAAKTGTKLVHIPIKAGGSQIIRDLINGDIQVTFFNIANSASMIKAGRLRPLAIALDARHPEWPDVPTLAEAGLSGVEAGQWQALFAPAGTPPAIVEALNQATAEATASQPVQDYFKKGGIVASSTKTSDEAQQWLTAEMAKWKKVIDELKIKAEE